MRTESICNLSMAKVTWCYLPYFFFFCTFIHFAVDVWIRSDSYIWNDTVTIFCSVCAASINISWESAMLIHAFIKWVCPCFQSLTSLFTPIDYLHLATTLLLIAITVYSIHFVQLCIEYDHRFTVKVQRKQEKKTINTQVDIITSKVWVIQSPIEIIK